MEITLYRLQRARPTRADRYTRADTPRAPPFVMATTLQERFTYHEGRPLRYLTGGSGPPMLLCHGFIGSAENFDDWFAALLPRRTVVAPDLPDLGRSAPVNGEHVATSMARAALSAVADAGADSYDVAGYAQVQAV